MPPPNPPLPTGTQGVHHQELSKSLSEPLTPDEMFGVVQKERGFHSAPADKTDGLRKQPNTLPPNWSDPGKVGQEVGSGRNTVGAIQILDKNGRRVGFATGIYPGGKDLEKHAEPIALRGLDKNGPIGTVDGGKMVLVIEKTPCEHCRPKLIAYAENKGLSAIEIHMAERPKLVGSGNVTPKTATRTSMMANRDFVVKLNEEVKIRPRSGPSGGSAPTGGARSAVVGTMAKLAAGIALDIFREGFKAKVVKDLENLPKPKIDKRSAQEFFTAPNPGKGLRVVDLLAKKLQPFAKELSEHHTKVIFTANAEIATLALSSLSLEPRLEFIGSVKDQLDVYSNQLRIVRDNLEEAKKLESKCMEAVQAAEELSKLMERAIIADWLLKQGFSFDEIVTIYDNLKDFSGRMRGMFRDLNALLAQVETHIQEQATLSSSLTKLNWSLILEEAKKRSEAAH